MRGHGTLMWMCGVMLAVALVVVAVTGTGFVVLPALGCLAMMAMMMWMMMGHMGGHARRRSSDEK